MRVGRAAALVLLLASACGRGPAGPSPDTLCEPQFDAPAGFEVVERVEVEEGDHVGVRVGLRDAEGRRLNVAAGISGEFGEGAPLAGTVGVAGGEEARLLGEGLEWVLAWESSGPCGSHAVVGSGLDRHAFLDALREAGIIVE